MLFGRSMCPLDIGHAPHREPRFLWLPCLCAKSSSKWRLFGPFVEFVAFGASRGHATEPLPPGLAESFEILWFSFVVGALPFLIASPLLHWIICTLPQREGRCFHWLFSYVEDFIVSLKPDFIRMASS